MPFVANESMVELLQKRLQPWNVSLPAQYAGIAAMQEKEYVEAFGAADCTGKRISHRTITSCGAGERCRTDCI